MFTNFSLSIIFPLILALSDIKQLFQDAMGLPCKGKTTLHFSIVYLPQNVYEILKFKEKSLLRRHGKTDGVQFGRIYEVRLLHAALGDQKINLSNKKFEN